MSLLYWLFGRRTKTERSPAPTSIEPAELKRLRFLCGDLHLHCIPSDFDPDGEETDLMWYGYVLRDGDGVARHYDDDDLREAGIMIFRVAGTSYRPDALQDRAFRPGNALALVLENYNQYDRNAVSIWDRTQSLMVGYVPRDLARPVRKNLKKYPGCRAICLGEFIKDGKRVGIRVMVGPLHE